MKSPGILITERLRDLAGVLRSRRLAFLVLAAFLVLCAIGAAIPQQGVDPSPVVAAWRRDHSRLASLELTRLFSTSYFLALNALAFLALCASTADQARRTARNCRAADAVTAAMVFRQRTRTIVPGMADPGSMRQALPFAKWTANRDGTLWIGRRFAFARWTVVAFHCSLLLLLAGVFADRAVFYRGVYSLVEGDYFTAGNSRPAEEEEGFLSRGGVAPVTVRLARVDDAFRERSYEPGLASEVRIEDGRGAREALLTRADPLQVEGLTIYQSPLYGYAPVFTRVAKDGRRTTGTIRLAAGLAPDPDGVRRYEGSGRVPGENIVLHCRFEAWPGFTGVPEKILVTLSSPAAVLSAGLIAPGGEVKAGGNVYRLESIVYWTDLIVSRQPGVILLLLGFWGIVLSLLVFVCCDPQTLYAFIDREAGTTTLAVSCRRCLSAEERILCALSEKLGRTGRAAGAGSELAALRG